MSEWLYALAPLALAFYFLNPDRLALVMRSSSCIEGDRTVMCRVAHARR
jgi:hypothetical protein